MNFHRVLCSGPAPANDPARTKYCVECAITIATTDERGPLAQSSELAWDLRELRSFTTDWDVDEFPCFRVEPYEHWMKRGWYAAAAAKLLVSDLTFRLDQGGRGRDTVMPDEAKRAACFFLYAIDAANDDNDLAQRLTSVDHRDLGDKLREFIAANEATFERLFI